MNEARHAGPASMTMSHFKLVTADLAAAEHFYTALGLRCFSRNTGGEETVRQSQSWLSHDGAADRCVLILTQFLEIPPPAPPTYPGQCWLVFTVPDVDATLARIAALGGSTLRPAEDRPEHQVRAAVAADPEGHPIELVGPMLAA
jgi:predicted enzyme related to lactoylglutathione lyase